MTTDLNNPADELENNGNGDEAKEQAPNVSNADNQGQSLDEILARLSKVEVPDINEVVPNTRGKNDFVPNTKPPKENRKPLNGDYTEMLFGVTSKSIGEGASTSAREVEKAFGLKLKEIPYKTQVTLVLPGQSGQKLLIGYCVNTASKQSLYFPKRFFPQGFSLPDVGFKVKRSVLALLIS